MPTSKHINAVWNAWYTKERGGSRKITTDWLRAEKIAEEQILPSIGFNYIVRFSRFFLRHGVKYRQFSYDIYAERNGERWLIDVTVKARKVLEPPMMIILNRMGITNFGVVFMNKGFTQYLFKEAFIVKNQKTLSVAVIKDDYVLEAIKAIPTHSKLSALAMVNEIDTTK
jgi:hypothetical protein